MCYTPSVLKEGTWSSPQHLTENHLAISSGCSLSTGPGCDVLCTWHLWGSELVWLQINLSEHLQNCSFSDLGKKGSRNICVNWVLKGPVRPLFCEDFFFSLLPTLFFPYLILAEFGTRTRISIRVM